MLDVAILNYPGAQQAAVLGMTDLLLAGAGAMPVLSVSHWTSGDGAPQRVYSSADGERGSGGEPALCILPPALGGVGDDVDPFLVRWLRDRHAGGAVLASVCSGAFVLGATGLLDRRPATTHWSYEDRFRTRFPAVLLDTDRIVIDDGDIVTAGGVMAWTDLCMTIIARFAGHAAMLDVARNFLIDPPRRAQSYYSGFSPHVGHKDAAILKVQRFLHDTGGRIGDVPTLAAQAGLQDRTFLRRFRKATGHTSTEYWQRLRVSNARAKLRETDLGVDQIGWEVGYVDPGAFRKVFRRIVGLSPSEYRRRFSTTDDETGQALSPAAPDIP
jgi:transcriptional regulator GlxA family with amidase domain